MIFSTIVFIWVFIALGSFILDFMTFKESVEEMTKFIDEPYDVFHVWFHEVIKQIMLALTMMLAYGM